MNVKALIDQYARQLARVDLEVLISHALAVPRSWLLAHDLDVLNDAQISACQQLIERRLTGEPVAHIVGYRDFWTFRLAVNPSTLIPRPDTEILVEAALERLPDDGWVVDVGTGTGAVALALAVEKPRATVLAGELSTPACALAKQNIAAIAPTKVSLWQGSWLAAIAGESLDMVVSNPPYIDGQDNHLQQGDVRFEPASALVAPKQGLADIGQLAKQALVCLKPGGWLLFEHGYDQGEVCQHILRALGYQNVAGRRDYGGQARVTLGRKSC